MDSEFVSASIKTDAHTAIRDLANELSRGKGKRVTISEAILLAVQITRQELATDREDDPFKFLESIG